MYSVLNLRTEGPATDDDHLNIPVGSDIDNIVMVKFLNFKVKANIYLS